MVSKDYAMNLLVYPRTEDNNGFFDCLIKKTNYDKQKGHKKAGIIRAELGIEKGIKINFGEMPRIVDYFSKLLKKPLKCRIFSYAHTLLIEHNIVDTDAELVEIYLGYKDDDFKYAFVKNPVLECRSCGSLYGDQHPWNLICWRDEMRIDGERSFLNGDYENYEDDPNNYDGNRLTGF